MKDFYRRSYEHFWSFNMVSRTWLGAFANDLVPAVAVVGTALAAGIAVVLTVTSYTSYRINRASIEYKRLTNQNSIRFKFRDTWLRLGWQLHTAYCVPPSFRSSARTLLILFQKRDLSLDLIYQILEYCSIGWFESLDSSFQKKIMYWNLYAGVKN
jgi:hypothetical protein